MNTDVLGPLAALVKRASAAAPAQGSDATLGRQMTGLGALGAAAGFGGKHLADRFLQAHPVQSAAHDIGDLARSLFGGPKPPPQAALSKVNLAKLFQARGTGLGKIGLGVLGAGIPAWSLGSKLDRAGAANASLQGQTADLRAQVDQLRGQLAAKPAGPAPGQPAGLAGMLRQAGTAKQAFDVRAALEKRAGIGTVLGKTFGGIGRGIGAGTRAAAPLFTRPAAAGGRQLSPLRSAATLGGLGYGGALAGHHTGLLSADPTRGMDATQRWRYHMGEYNQMASPLRQQVEAGYAKGSPEGFAEADRAMGELEAGNFGGSGVLRNNMLTRTFAPWLAGDRNAGYHQQQATAANQEFQSELDRVRGVNAARPGQFQGAIAGLQQRLNNPMLLPQHRQLISAQIARLRQQMGALPTGESPEAQALIRRMQANGMAIDPTGGFGQAAPGAYRPGGPGEARPGPMPDAGQYRPGRPSFYTEADFAPDGYSAAANAGGLRGR